MTTTILRPCSRPGCPAYALVRGYCEAHKRTYEERYGTASERGYGSVWRRIRLRILARDPVCYACNEPSVEVDHVVQKRHGGSDVDHNLRGSCTHCNRSRKVIA